MFRKELQRRLKEIFGLPKVSFSAPGEAQEQDTLFVTIEDARCRAMQGKEEARVRGGLLAFSQGEKLPFGFFMKRVSQAPAELTKDFFFFDNDRNIETFQNIVERRVSFVFLYSGNYNPARGEITELSFAGEN